MVDNPQMRMRIILVWFHNLSSCCRHRILAMNASYTLWPKTPLFFFFWTLLEEYLPQNILFLVVSIVVFDVIVMGLVEDAIWIMIAVRVLISYSSDLAQLRMWILIRTFPVLRLWATISIILLRVIAWGTAWSTSWVSCMLLREILAG